MNGLQEQAARAVWLGCPSSHIDLPKRRWVYYHVRQQLQRHYTVDVQEGKTGGMIMSKDPKRKRREPNIQRLVTSVKKWLSVTVIDQIKQDKEVAEGRGG